MMSFKRHAKAAGVVSVLLLAGCATSLETCDPDAVGDLGTSMACDGYFKERIARLEARISAIEEAARRELAASQQAQTTATDAGRQVKAEQAALKAVEADIARMKVQLSGMRRESEADRRIVNAARQQVADAEAQLAEARKNGGPSVQEVDRLRSTVASKNKAFDALNSLYDEVL